MRLLLLIMLSLCQMVRAQTVSSLSALQSVSSTGSWTLEQTREFTASLLAEGLQPTSQKMLQALVNASAPVTLEVEGQNVTVPAPQGRSRDLLVLLAAPPNMNKLWEGSPEEYRQLVDLSTLSPGAHNRVVSFYVARLTPAWEQSKFANAYAPANAVVAICVKKSDRFDAETKELGRRLLYQSCSLVKNSAGEPMPPFIYNWMF